MDLGAYIQIEDLENIAKKNGIVIPRCRGYRLMKEEEPVDEQTIQEITLSIFISEVQDIITEEKQYGITMYRCMEDQEKLLYFVLDDTGCPIDVNMHNFHGKLRNKLKIRKHLIEKTVRRQWDMWNRYVGKDNILYIHAKQGRTNWSNTTWQNFQKKEWFLEAIDDSFDSCYCDIYAKIKEK